MNSTRLLIGVVVLQAAALLCVWTGKSPITPAYGQIPDAGGQRQAMIEEMKTLNGKMDKLMELLRSGEIQVKTPQADVKK